MQKYSSYLPLYMGGRNIDRHSMVIEEADARYYSTLQLMREWCNLERPVMIQRIATESLVTYNVVVKSRKPLLSLKITGDYDYSISWGEEEVVTEYSYSFTFPNSTGVDMHRFLVTVSDYDDVTLMKGYPENDDRLGDLYDHDEFIDRMGSLVGLPRKQYISYNLSDASSSLPPFMGKQVTGGVVDECTEDDYYYLERIRLFVSQFGKQNLASLLLQLIYGYSDIVEVNSTLLENQQLVDNLNTQDPSFIENISPGCYVFLIPETSPSNYEEISIDEKKDFIEKYLPITRYALLANTIHTTMGINDVTAPVVELPGANRVELYLHDYAFDVTFEEEGVDERVTTDCQLTYQLDNYNPVLIDYDTEDSTSYRDTHLLGPGWHTVQLSYPATLGYESCNSVYMFKHWIDAYHNFIGEYPVYYPFYTPDSTSGDNLIQNRSSGRYYKQANNTSINPFTLNLGMINRDNMLVLEYDITAPGTEYLFGVGVTGQSYTANSDPRRQLNTPLSGDHTVSIALPAGEIYVDGRLATLNKEVNTKYTYNNLFLTIPNPNGSLQITESRVSQFIPYYDTGGGVYLPNGFCTWQEYTLRAIIECTETTPTLTMFVGLNDTSGFQMLLPSQTSGRHVITMQVVNNIGYLYFDDEESGHLYDFDECKQYRYTPPYPESKVLVREDPFLVFNTACKFKLEEDERVRVVSVGICPTTLRSEVEEHTPVKQVSLSCTPEVDELMGHLIEGYNMHFDISCMDEDTPIDLPLTLLLGDELYYPTECNGTYATVINEGMVHDGSIYYEFRSPQGRYYLDAVDSGYISITPTARAIFLEYVELTAGETSTLTARLFDDEGNPLTGSQYKTVFKVGGKSVKQGSSVYYTYPDSNGVVTCEYDVPSNPSGKMRTVQAVVTGTSNRLESNIRNVKVR